MIAVLRDQVTRGPLAREVVVTGIVLAGLSLFSSQELYTRLTGGTSRPPS